MMRKLKFRAWDNFDKKWYTGVSEYLWLDSKFFELNNDDLDEDLTYEQFTGLLDKNGKEIYEGDILIFSKWKYQVQIKWSQITGGWYMLHHGGKNHLCGCNFLNEFNSKLENDGGYEIIGNIHENKDLLGEK